MTTHSRRRFEVIWERGALLRLSRLPSHLNYSMIEDDDGAARLYGSRVELHDAALVRVMEILAQHPSLRVVAKIVERPSIVLRGVVTPVVTTVYRFMGGR